MGIILPKSNAQCFSGITEVCPGQGDEAWFAERRLRVTASIAKSVIMASNDNVRANLVRRKLWEPPVKAASLEYCQAFKKNFQTCLLERVGCG